MAWSSNLFKGVTMYPMFKESTLYKEDWKDWWIISDIGRLPRDFPGGIVVKTSLSNARCMSLIPGQGATIPHVIDDSYI